MNNKSEKLINWCQKKQTSQKSNKLFKKMYFWKTVKEKDKVEKIKLKKVTN